MVSIIITAYNAERYIKRAILSVLNQTRKDIEVVVIDDGSTDHTAEIVKSFRDSRIRYIYQKNQNVGSARNRGIRESRGKYLTFLDPDDEYLPEKVAAEAEFLESNPEYQAVYCDTVQFYSDNPEKLFRKKGQKPSGNIFPHLLHSSVVNPNTFMATKDLIEKVGMFDEDPDSPEDWELWLRIAGAGYLFGYIDRALVRVEMRKDSRTTSDVNFRGKKYLLEIFENVFSAMSPKERERYKTGKILQDLKWKIAFICLINNNTEELRQITPGISSAPRRFFVLALKIIPAPLRGAFLSSLWKLYQRISFAQV